MNRQLLSAATAVAAFVGILSCSDATAPNGLSTDDLSVDEARIVGSITVTLAASSIQVGEKTRASATVLDRRGRPLNRSINWSSSNTASATVTDSGVVTGVAPGSAVITASRDGHSGSATVTVTAIQDTATPPPPPPPPPPSDGNPNEPAGMTKVTLREFNALDEDHDWKDDEDPCIIADDPTAPSPSKVWRAEYPTGFVAGSAACASWLYVRNQYHTVYLSYWFKYSSNWYGQSTGTNKQLYVWTNGVKPKMYIFARGTRNGELEPYATIQGSRVPQNDELLLGPNLVPSARIIRGQWHHIELVLVGNTPATANGSLDLYLDGVHVSSYSGMQFTDEDAFWYDVNVAPVWGGLGGTVPATQTFDIDHFYMSGKN